MSPALQAKLLRVLQEREFERVGDSHTIKIDVRVIAATHSDLAQDGRGRDVPRGSLLPLNVHPGAAAAAARAPRRHSAAGAALPAEALAPDSGRGADDGVAGGDAPADGVSLARQRPAAREHRRARDRLQPGALADRRPGSAARKSRISRPSSTGPEPWLPEDGLDFERYIEAIELSLIKRSLERTQRQQAPGGEAAEPEAHDPHRETEAARSPTAARITECLHASPTGRSSSKASRRRSAPANARSSCRRSSSCRAKHPDAVMMWFATGPAVGIAGRGARGRGRSGESGENRMAAGRRAQGSAGTLRHSPRREAAALRGTAAPGPRRTESA